MGGKKKQQAQRTKNNAKPSNSGRTAELLTANIGILKGIADSQFSSNLPQVSSTALDFIDPKTDPNFQIVLKKMTKKDGITRHKALTEFVNLCNECGPDAVKSALPFWAHVYGNLALDVEHRVREAAQHAHHAIVSQVGRNLAPYIKQIAPQWFISQYDTYAPAASAASNSFKAAFPPHKLVDVIVFCQMEILQYISENILIQSSENIPKTDKKNKDELEARHERILISSLNGYTLYLSKIPKEHIGKAVEIHVNIITSPKFWKLPSYKNGAVRAAWFSLLSSFLQFAPDLMESQNKRIVNTVLGHIDDYDPVVLPKVWEAALHVVTTVENCWQHVNMDKFFMPKFCHIIEQGGQGNAYFIYPNIILLISNIPKEVMKDKVTFFGKIFSSFQKGLNQSSVIQSQTESEAVATALFECIQYLIMIHTDETEFCIFLIEHFVIEAISVTMLDSIHHHLKYPLFTSLAQILLHWKNNETQNVKYKSYTEIFWTKFIALCKVNMSNCLSDKDTLAILFDSNQNMLDVLNNRRCKKRKNLKVKFSTDDIVSSDEVSLEKSEQSTFAVDTKLQSNIIIAARELIKEYINIANECESYDIKLLTIKQLEKVIIIFQKEQIIKLIDGLESDLCSSICNWIKDDEIPTESLVGVVFAVIDNVQDKKQIETTLMELTKIRSKDAILEAAKLAYFHVNDTLVTWMKSPLVRDELCNLYKNLNEEEDISVDVLHQCLTNYSSSKGFIIGEESVLSLLSVVTEQLKTRTFSNIKNLTAILDSVFSNNSQNNLRNYKEILLELLYLCFQVIICNKSWDTLFIVWQKGLHSLGTLLIPNDPLLKEHISLCANLVADYINESNGTPNDVVLSMIIKVSTTFIHSLVQQNSESDVGIDISKLFLTSVLNKSINIHKKKIEDVCFHTEILHGNLFNGEIDDTDIKNSMVILKEKWDPLKEINFISYIRSLVFCVKYILYLMGETYSDEYNSEIEDIQDTPLQNFNFSKINDLVQICLNLCYGLVLAETLKNHYSDTKQYFAVGDSAKSLRYLLKELIHRLDSEQQSQILSLAQENSKQLGKQWSQTWYILAVEFLDLEKKISSKLLSENLTNESILNIEYLCALRSDMTNNYVEELELSTFLDNLIKIYKEQSVNSCCVDLSNFKGNNLRQVSEIARLLTTYIKNYPLEIDKSQNGWDFIMISTSSWVKSISLTKSSSYYNEFVEFVVAVSDLYLNFILYLVKEKKGTNLFQEWTDVFFNETFDSLGVAWEFIASKTLNSNLNYVGLLHLKKLSDMLCKSCQIEEIRLLQVNENNYETWVFKARKFIISPCIPVQITSYYILLTIIPILVKLDSSLDENELHKLTCELIKNTFIETQNVVSTMLQDFSLGVSCSVAPFTDSYTYTFGYLLIWSVLLEMCKQGDSQLRYIYTLWIKEMNLIPHIMESLLKLMPDSVLHFLESNVKKRYELFTEMPALVFDGWESDRLSHFCCWLFCDLLRTLPAVVRQWSAETEQKLASYADKITTSYVSVALCSEEMKAIVNQQKAFDNMKVSTHPCVREVVAVYTVEESSTELIVTLAANHPLSPPKVEIPKAMISSNQTRQWLMQLTIFLTHQNGSIWDGLLLWKSNLDKKFEGIEECYICFSILHNTSHQLPKLSCQTCKKKFHSFCLYKWFTTSNKSTCPICRNHF